MTRTHASLALTNRVFISENSHFPVRKWTVSNCQFLVDNGLLDPASFELIEGEIVAKMGQGRKHISVVSRVSDWLREVFPRAVQDQAPIGIGQFDEYNDPEPDIAVVRGKVTDYSEREPVPSADILLCVEASKTTLLGDKTTKSRIYGKHGVPEYWVIAIDLRELIVYREPNVAEGGYADVRIYVENETVSPLACPDATIAVADLLP